MSSLNLYSFSEASINDADFLLGYLFDRTKFYLINAEWLNSSGSSCKSCMSQMIMGYKRSISSFLKATFLLSCRLYVGIYLLFSSWAWYSNIQSASKFAIILAINFVGGDCLLSIIWTCSGGFSCDHG